MFLNQIPENEHARRMRYAAADNSSDVRIDRRKPNMFEMLLTAHPFLHRPYFSAHDFEDQPAAVAEGWSGLMNGLAEWENEGGRLELAKSQKRSNREIRKPKAEKPKALPTVPAFPVSDLMKKPKRKR